MLTSGKSFLRILSTSPILSVVNDSLRCAPAIGTYLRARFGGEEDEAEFANLNFIPSPKLLIIYAHAIHICAVQATYIAHTPPLCATPKLSMPTAHRDIVKENIGLGSATDAHKILR
jgi:hypothetical protein